MRWLLALPFRLVGQIFVLVSMGSSKTADVFVSIASFIDPQE